MDNQVSEVYFGALQTFHLFDFSSSTLEGTLWILPLIESPVFWDPLSDNFLSERIPKDKWYKKLRGEKSKIRQNLPLA